MLKRTMDKNKSIVPYKCLMFIFFIVRFCTGYSCHKDLPNQMTSGNSTWKLCIININKETLRFKIKSLFSNQKSKSSQWLNIGFPEASLKTNIPFFLLVVNAADPKSVVVKQTNEMKNKVNCSVSAKESLKLSSVDCVFKKTANKYLNSKTIKIFWHTGSGNRTVVEAGKNLIKNHSILYFHLHQDKDAPDENAGSTAMRLLRNYGKSMSVILGISILLTALITLTICCCCKKKTPLNFSKQKISKDSSVSYYRDDSEGDGQSDESDNDEKVAFIRNNNERNSTV